MIASTHPDWPIARVKPFVDFAVAVVNDGQRRKGIKRKVKPLLKVKRSLNTWYFGGQAYVGGKEVTVTLGWSGLHEIYPYAQQYRGYKNMPIFTVVSDEEMMLFLLAHEFQHLAGTHGNRAGEVYCEWTGWEAVTMLRSRRLQEAENNELMD